MTQLYLITPPRIDAQFADTLAEALSSGDVAALQIRLKDHAPDEIRQLAPPLIALAQAHGVAAILNDDAALAAELGCDGVHLGQSDGQVKEARAMLGKERTIGVTCHDSRHLAMLAGEAGADYVAFGAFFPTTTNHTIPQPTPTQRHPQKNTTQRNNKKILDGNKFRGNTTTTHSVRTKSTKNNSVVDVISYTTLCFCARKGEAL